MKISRLGINATGAKNRVGAAAVWRVTRCSLGQRVSRRSTPCAGEDLIKGVRDGRTLVLQTSHFLTQLVKPNGNKFQRVQDESYTLNGKDWIETRRVRTHTGRHVSHQWCNEASAVVVKQRGLNDDDVRYGLALLAHIAMHVKLSHGTKLSVKEWNIHLQTNLLPR
jgi:hypothetical protein